MTTLNEMRIRRDIISNEAHLVEDVANALKETFPGLVAGLMGFFKQFSPNDPAPKLTSDQNGFVKIAEETRYMDIRPLAAYVPEGMICSYLEYAAALQQACEAVADKETGVIAVLSQYSVFLSQLISNNNFKMTSKSHDAIYKKLDDRRTEHNANMGKCFAVGSTKTQVTYGQVIARNKDWPNVFISVDNITKVICSVDRSTLNAKIRECAELLSTVVRKAQNNDFDGMSPTALVNLSSGAFEIAKELEFFSAVYYKCMAYSESVNRTVAHFRTVAKT